jgi:ribonuclease BN (tRNA processing enzyme)
MTAHEAGYRAAAAGAKRLLLTHFWPGTSRAEFVRRAKTHFGGDVLAAEERLVVSL